MAPVLCSDRAARCAFDHAPFGDAPFDTQVVQLVRKNVGAITLAIGDGANDVSMIQVPFCFLQSTTVRSSSCAQRLRTGGSRRHRHQRRRGSAGANASVACLLRALRVLSVCVFFANLSDSGFFKIGLVVQAARAADYAIAQFRFLRPLLLVSLVCVCSLFSVSSDGTGHVRIRCTAVTRIDASPNWFLVFLCCFCHLISARR